MRTLKFFFISCLIIALFLGTERLCHLVTDGFALTKITHPLPQDLEFTPPPLSSDQKNLLNIALSQPFYYLSCGGQSYVFLSQDGHYVIKFLKFHHRRIPQWIHKLPLPRLLAQYRAVKIARKEFRLKRTLRSYVIAYDLLKQETGMIYHHLETTHFLKRSLTIFDRLGYRYDLNLDDYAFLVQKRGCSTAEMLAQLMKEEKIEEAKQHLSDLFTLCIQRCQKGIGDRDFKFRSNLGFIDNKASQIDLGSLILDPRQCDSEVYQATIYESAERFRPWLLKNHPLLIEHFDQELAKLSNHPIH